jgi:hypothetical protein
VTTKNTINNTISTTGGDGGAEMTVGAAGSGDTAGSQVAAQMGSSPPLAELSMDLAGA